MKKFIRRTFELGDTIYYEMRNATRLRLWRIATSERKLSAQLEEVKGRERDLILRMSRGN